MAKDDRPSQIIRQQALTAMLSNAFFTWPTAITLGFSVVAVFLFGSIFPWWQPWFWLVFGIVTEFIYVAVTLTDPVANQQAVERMFTEKFDPRSIRNASARQRMYKALEYKRSIDAFVDQQHGALKVSLGQTASEIQSWIALIYRLARATDTFDGNSIIDRDRRNVPTELENLKHRLTVETDGGIQAELKDAIAIRQRLLDNLQSIATSVKRTEIKLDSTLAQLSTVYAQMQLIDTKELDGGRTQRLRSEIQDEIASLSDLISAMDDVYAYQGYKTALNDNTMPGATSINVSVDEIAPQKVTRSGGNG
jgi:hypothetical protein